MCTWLLNLIFSSDTDDFSSAQVWIRDWLDIIIKDQLIIAHDTRQSKLLIFRRGQVQNKDEWTVQAKVLGVK